jgi:hypothetical protein
MKIFYVTHWSIKPLLVQFSYPSLKVFDFFLLLVWFNFVKNFETIDGFKFVAIRVMTLINFLDHYVNCKKKYLLLSHQFYVGDEYDKYHEYHVIYFYSANHQYKHVYNLSKKKKIEEWFFFDKWLL